MPSRLPFPTRRSGYRSRLNRRQSPIRIAIVPPLSVMAASMITALPVMTDQPILPSFGLLMLLGWRLLRTNSWPLWAGFPLGVWDDLFSGQPMGSAALSWSAILLALQFVESRVAFRNYWTDWMAASVSLAFASCAGLYIVGLIQPRPAPAILIPQLIFAILCFPLVLRICARLDRWRLST